MPPAITLQSVGVSPLQFGSHQPPQQPSPIPAPTHTQVPPQLHRTHTSSSKRRTLGDWDLLKTIGAGSMGKVKLARHRMTGEVAAVKIVPRYVPEGLLHARNPKYLNISRAGTADSERHTERREEGTNKSSSDESKEIRTIREAAIASLLDHRYICAVREVMVMTHHYYMVFEYVNGGQMLDYIISHGRLKEKQARKFARQIASALDYCHHNSVVHRDLKIENILISKSGDIKIIDFGLSNLYSPRSLLKTFCGSLYFAAPELLNAKQYVGPEVDIWSFGIVLYVLACGKVPFDDQSMPALHAKIKRGHVEYPNWLSAECKNLLSRMLVVDPKARATLSEIVNHPWMLKGYDGPQDSYIPNRRPLMFPLDKEVIRGMHGFEFGSDERIEADLTAIIESPEYQAACQAWYKNEAASMSSGGHFNGFLSAASPLSPSFSFFDSTSNHSGHSSTKKKSAFPFDFYKRRQSNASSSSSQETLSDGKPPDPTNAFHPLISIYYLVREQQERLKRRPTLDATSSALSLSNSGFSNTFGPALTPTSSLSSSQAMLKRTARLEIPVIPVPETAHTHNQPSRAMFPGRSRSVNHGHSGYMPGHSDSNLSTSPTSGSEGPQQNGTRQQHVVELPPIPSEGTSPEEKPRPRRITVDTTAPPVESDHQYSGPAPTNPSSRRDGISFGGILRRLSTRRSHRSNSTHAAGGGSHPPLSPSAGSASSEDERAPLPTINSFSAQAYEDLPPPPPPPAPPQSHPNSPGVTFTPETEKRSGAGKQSSTGAPQTFIRFERLFSRASTLGRSTSISEGTYNRRISRV
ncbi:kinase-like domain-containing protein [Lipomyces orientalis]|uniref:Kinase-like domain-containing protein n=1 Tax=Lipomyces orientalis TaxID=1233043 RepID=A0ACC3THX0_9ASCO